MVRQIDIRQGTPEWLEYRKDKRNASEAGNVMGVGFMKPEKFARVKFLGEEIYTNAAMRDGLEYEDKIRKILNDEFKSNFIPATFLNGKYSASLDGYDKKINLFCEIKMSQNEYDFLEKNKKPSPKYYAQVQQQLYTMEAEEAIFAVGYVNDDFNLKVKHIVVKRDEAFIQELLRAWDDFYAKYANISDKNIYIAEGDLAKLVKKTNELNEILLRTEQELKECKEKLIKYANGSDIKIENITISKVTRKPTFDYKAYCDSIDAKIGNEFLKEGGVSWNVRINKIKTGE